MNQFQIVINCLIGNKIKYYTYKSNKYYYNQFEKNKITQNYLTAYT